MREVKRHLQDFSGLTVCRSTRLLGTLVTYDLRHVTCHCCIVITAKLIGAIPRERTHP
jgi:hypothetical protein